MQEKTSISVSQSRLSLAPQKTSLITQIAAEAGIDLQQPNYYHNYLSIFSILCNKGALSPDGRFLVLKYYGYYNLRVLEITTGRWFEITESSQIITVKITNQNWLILTTDYSIGIYLFRGCKCQLNNQ